MVGCPFLGAAGVTIDLQTQLENVQNREIVLEKNLSLIQQKELLTLESALRVTMQDFLKNESRDLLDTNPAFQPAVQQYAQLLLAMNQELTPLYYDALFWVRYIPAFLAQEAVTELPKDTLTFPLLPAYVKILKDFSQTYYAYKIFFEQWPVDKQQMPQVQFYLKAKDAYEKFSVTQSFVTSLLAQQQDMLTTQNQLNLLISTFKKQMYELKAPTLSDKTQYEHMLSVYEQQLGSKEVEQYKEYQVWLFISSLLYYRNRAGVPIPDDSTNAQLFHTMYNEFVSFVAAFQKKWTYYKEAHNALDALSSYDQACVTFLEPSVKPNPAPTPKPHPLPVPQPVTPKPVLPTPVQPHQPKINPGSPEKTVSEQLDDYILKYFSDTALATTVHLTPVLALYNNLLEDYKASAEYRETDYSGYAAWADFVPLRVAELQVIALTRAMPIEQRKPVVFAYNQALKNFRKTKSWDYVSKTYPSLFKEVTEVCPQYANWLGQQR